MARILTFKIDEMTFEVSPLKVERKKLYGRSELRVTDAAGKLCHQCGINNDGTTLVEAGYVKSGILTNDGLWTDRAELVAVDKDNNPVSPVESSFGSEIILREKATTEDLLNLKVLSVYQLTSLDSARLATAIGDDIYSFEFSYSGGYEFLKAFMIASGGAIYIIAGSPSEFEYLSLGQYGNIDMEEDAEVDEELDFSMF